MRILEAQGIAYTHYEYECDEFTDGSETADRLGLAHEEVFKTLVAVGNDGQHYVYVIPVDESLDLKKCARVSGVKAVQLIHVKELFPLTGKSSVCCGKNGGSSAAKFMKKRNVLFKGCCPSDHYMT